MTQPTKKLARLNSEVAFAPASNPVQDREERKLQYYMELFARQEKLQQQKLQQQPASQASQASQPSQPPVRKEEKPPAGTVAPEKERKKPGRKPKQPPTETPAELPPPKEEETPVQDKLPRKKPGRKSKSELEQLRQAQAQTQTGGIAAAPRQWGVVTRRGAAETIDEQTRTVGRRKVGLSVLAEKAKPEKTTSNTPKSTTAVPREMSKPIPTDDFATDPVEWAKQFIIYY